MKIFFKTIFLFIVILIYLYLFLPSAVIPPLPESLKSTEPGDTVEIPGVSAYYTDTKRSEVINFYYQVFSRSRFLGIPLPTILLDYPPEYKKEAIRDTTESTFLYELVHPGRDSLYINGWDPKEDPKYKLSPLVNEVIKKEGRFYERKITIRLIKSNLFWRFIIFSSGLILLLIIGNEFKKVIVSFWKSKR